MFKLWPLKIFTNKVYHLTPFELKDNVPFETKRVYWVTQSAGIPTGQHCHFEEQEVFVCIAGAMTAVIDKGEGKEMFDMKEGDALYAPNFVWHGFENLSADAVLLAFSSTNYRADRSDYCEDYEQYVAEYRGKIVNE
ncbi:MAG: FdtA/QdtA family cupin domain-containing protein [Candidatus Magasanikbacteria bacterium]|nr:FdtA/QdtA family cupin domain-containing protein [Candidatus Magasanikbacteria bacterium]